MSQNQNENQPSKQQKSRNESQDWKRSGQNMEKGGKKFDSSTEESQIKRKPGEKRSGAQESGSDRQNPSRNQNR